ncbi:hypothetical protein [Methylobacterium haplocladii]|uniref:Uncharacterized protein n=1 Tax=Methylobacterium haplocladii TaxID=1176176 RepID=A0A512IPY0_9HYPH|nr:hypothetical protein [Methylobacterium haplocladii]GEO99757.1 hypothetical protein MHA02_21450 [Methylobacterium haplocladii]GJD84610.1 hypothetical protein HPGCJGGD_2490 [Methylobacterium haplocladii]GLS60150.1 hypothetical protein GCM10007887_28280 [Methylobacterium haplocladii]
MLPSTTRDPRDPGVLRVERELVRLEALAARKRFRIAILRALRGFVGAGGALATMLKLKIAGSVVLKIGLAVIVGLGFAWPLYAFAAVILGFAILSILDSSSGSAPSCDCPGDCERKESRRARLDRLIEQRKTWLVANAVAQPPNVGVAR